MAMGRKQWLNRKEDGPGHDYHVAARRQGDMIAIEKYLLPGHLRTGWQEDQWIMLYQ